MSTSQGSKARSSSRRPTRCPRAPPSCSPPTASRPRSTSRLRPGGCSSIDATCPLVTKVHHEAQRFAADDLDIVLIGHEGHEEVVGTTGQAPDHMHLVDGIEEAAAVQVRDPSRVAYLSQTTLSVDETNVTVDALRERFPLLQGPPSADICYATQNRQAAVKEIAAAVRPGARRRLAQLVQLRAPRRGRARRRRATPYLVDDASEVDEAWLAGVTTVGLTSGASVPEVLVVGVLAWLAARGYADVEEVEAAEEHLLFALPPELRRDLRAAGLRRARLTTRRRPVAAAAASASSGRRIGDRPATTSARPVTSTGAPTTSASTISNACRAIGPRRPAPRDPASAASATHGEHDRRGDHTAAGHVGGRRPRAMSAAEDEPGREPDAEPPAGGHVERPRRAARRECDQDRRRRW